MDTPQEAMTLAKELLDGMDRRWSHVMRVAARAEELAATLIDNVSEGEALVMAAWLHDIGYAGTLAKTGFHHLDGANYLEEIGEHRLACLVAHHSSGTQEGHLRGFDQEMSRFPVEPGLIADCLTYCDLSNGPDGQPMELTQRIDEVESRYGKDDVVPKGLQLAYPQLTKSFTHVELLRSQVVSNE
jgi:predicted HD phosphohydrolase